jgi:hypothetical protein
MLAEPETKFFPTAFDAEIEFVRDAQGNVSYLTLRQNGHETKGGRNKIFIILLGFLRKKVPESEQNRKKPEKTCGNQRFVVDKALGKDEGELR